MKTLQQKKQEYKEKINKMMNPFVDFDPDNFEPSAGADEKEYMYRKRVKPPLELPTFGLKPREMVVGQMIGMYENRQDLYLTFAHRCNDMQKEIDLLKEEIKKLKK